MDQTLNTSETTKAPLLEQDAGYYYSTTIVVSPEELFTFCQDERYLKQVLTDLPGDVENFLDLELSSQEALDPNEYKIVWRNKPESKFEGTFTFLLKQAPANRGTILTGQAKFEKINFQEEGPSTLVNIFLKRLKALKETGEIATIKGQPSGREEIKSVH